MAAESTLAFAWLFQVLSTDSTLAGLVTGFYRGVAPVGTTPPWVTFDLHSPTDVTTVTGIRLFTRDLYQVQAVGPESLFATLEAAADRIDALLNLARNASITTQSGHSGTLLACVREGQIALPDDVPGSSYGTAWRLLGGLYRLTIQGS